MTRYAVVSREAVLDADEMWDGFLDYVLHDYQTGEDLAKRRWNVMDPEREFRREEGRAELEALRQDLVRGGARRERALRSFGQ